MSIQSVSVTADRIQRDFHQWCVGVCPAVAVNYIVQAVPMCETHDRAMFAVERLADKRDGDTRREGKADGRRRGSNAPFFKFSPGSGFTAPYTVGIPRIQFKSVRTDSAW